MNKNLPQAQALAADVARELAAKPAAEVQVIVAPPYPFIAPVAQALNGSSVAVAAQNVAEHKQGAYTGEVSAEMLQSAGARYAIIGHSERRQYYGDTDKTISTKVDRALEFGLQVIFCCGETLDQRKSNSHVAVVNSQISEALGHLSPTDMERVIVAYEPVWAIGTGETATPQQAQDMHQSIRQQLESLFGGEIAQNTSILYGGSCKPANARELFACADIDGGLIGGASLNAPDFCTIIHSFGA